MKKPFLYILLLVSIAIASCHEAMVEPTDAPKAALKAALDALHSDDLDTYLQSVDFSTEMDSLQLVCMKAVLSQHAEEQAAEGVSVQKVEMVDAVMESDSVCTVYYQQSYSGGASDVLSQKMVRQGDTWKIRLRN